VNRISPKLSVLMTAYNREKYIEEAIESVLVSTFNDFELLILDDGSTDDTQLIATKYCQIDERVRLFVNDINLGDYPNRNKAASLANGIYIMYVDSDDKILEDGFEKCVEFMDTNNANFGMQYDKKIETFFLNAETAIHKHFLVEPFLSIGPGGTIIRRSFFNEIGGYPTKYGPANDMYFNLKAANFSGVALITFPFNFYRIHDGQEQNNKFSYLYNNFNYLKDAVNELPFRLSPEQKNWILNKNRRRFTVNLILFFFKSWDLKKIIFAINKTSFNLNDIRLAIFH
jgi:glycosyltransferase involved in cell wall biosynthesis